MKDKVNDAVETARPYVERLAKDDELHEHVKRAYESARQIYDDVIGPATATGMARKVATDKDVQESFRSALDELREASRRMRGETSHTGRNMTLLITGIAVGVLFNPISGPETRRWLKEKILGPEDTSFEFDGPPADA